MKNMLKFSGFHFYFLIVLFFIFTFCACKKTETFVSPSLNDYFPLQTGKYISYQLDSLVYLSFGTRDTIISYQVKYQVDSLITDNLGRPAYRVLRFIRKNQQNTWRPEATLLAIATEKNIELIENNLRFVKLQLPIVNNFSWLGNSYIDTYSGNSPFRYLDAWEYTYSNIGDTATIGNQFLQNTLTVNQRDEEVGQVTDPQSYSEINYAQEKYAKGIGMVYKKFFHKEYQPNNGGYAADGSYGVTYTMIDHN
jgi:hypothetical protein